MCISNNKMCVKFASYLSNIIRNLSNINFIIKVIFAKKNIKHIVIYVWNSIYKFFLNLKHN